MASIVHRCLENKTIRLCLKFAVSAVIIFLVVQAVFVNGMKPYYTVKDYSYQNDFASDQIAVIQGKQADQHFIAKGNILTNISLFIKDPSSKTLNIALLDENSKTIKAEEISVSSLNVGAWNKIDFGCDIRRGREYSLQVYSENGLSSLVLDYGDRPDTYTGFIKEGEDTGAALAVGIQQTYAYLTWAGFFELLFTLFVYSVLALGLCYAVFNLEKLIRAWNIGHSKMSALYAVYFAVSLALVFDPLDAIRTGVQSFERVIGAGFINHVDVSRRITNFNHWYIYFAVALVLFYGLMNYCRQKKLREPQQRVLRALDQVIVLANVNLLLRCITYFSDKTSMQTVFYYSASVLMLVVLAGIAYIAFDLDQKIPSSDYTKVMVIAFSLSYPIAIISQHEWQGGKLLFGFQFITITIALILACLLYGRVKCGERSLTVSVHCFALIPFVTSFYIEFINILNQHEVYVYHLRRYYVITIFAIVAVTGILILAVNKKDVKVTKWKTWSYFWLIFGITCLLQQIPLEYTYDADVFESANQSILISDFLNYGDIPIVQHYGGHMMSGVWEGLLYALWNNDYAGAIFSPYSGYGYPVLAVLFFLLIRKTLGDETALLTTLFFPFMNAWSYYGLGMLVCAAVWSYFKRNTYWRAALVWLAFIWSALYRLDLGFSIGLACMAALAIYVVIYKNWKAAKQLIITLLAWGVFGGILWCLLCAMKQVNPVNRLIEFLLLSLSNQNWAYTDIGYTGNTIFAWCYVFVPFVIAGSLCYVVFSKKFREETTLEVWIALLILGFSYFTNFSRGLVRHSLSEMQTPIVLWNAFVYLALFMASYKRKELFLPSFLVLIVSCNILVTTANYNESTIGDRSASRVGDFTQGWTLDRLAYEDKNSDGAKTYWYQLYEKQEKVNRVEWADGLKMTMKPYEIVMDALLDEDETFVDFINRTFVYSAIGRRDPVYVSQSPLQLSGEFSQEMFVEEIENVPLVLMPVNDNRASNSLDGIANACRYYKVAEYIYQNYVPLCRYENSFAVWCRPDRYDEFKQKASNLVDGNDYVEALYRSDELWISNCERRIDKNTGKRYIAFTGVDPIVSGIHSFMDLSAYYDSFVKISVEYSTDVAGIMQIFYTTGKGEDFTGEKVSTVYIAGDGIAEFIVPVTEYTKLRLDIPEGSTVEIKSLRVSCPVTYIAYGYDMPSQSVDENGNTWNTYDNGFHTYGLAYLPSIWAEHDPAIDNTEYALLRYTNGYYVFDQDAVLTKEHGNYLLLRAAYDGTDTGRNYEDDDEAVKAVIKVGVYDNGIFTEKYQYDMSVKEGTNNYLIRVSNDYNWYCADVNAVKISCNGILYHVDMRVLEGD